MNARETLTLFYALLIFHSVPILVHAQAPPALDSVDIQAEVEFSAENGVFTYSYTVTNPKTNEASIWTIEIDISKPTTGADLSGEGLINEGDFHEHSSRAILEQALGVPMVPVGIKSPPNWIGGLSVGGTAGWGAARERFLMPPGLSMSGYQITSRGIPALRTFIVQPHLADEHLPSPPTDDGDLERYKREYSALKETVGLRGKTISPTAPAANFIPAVFLEIIISYKHQALELGWLGDEELVKKLDKQLKKAQKHLARGNSKKAVHELGKFQKEVDKRRKKTIKDEQKGKRRHKKFVTSEGWALLFYNAQHLLDQLP